jgi:hypothetical protein
VAHLARQQGLVFEMLWGAAARKLHTVADVTDVGPQCKSRTT